MSPEKQREIASKGGRMAHQKGAAHSGPLPKRVKPAGRADVRATDTGGDAARIGAVAIRQGHYPGAVARGVARNSED
jgi:hypothetical protein